MGGWFEKKKLPTNHKAEQQRVAKNDSNVSSKLLRNEGSVSPTANHLLPVPICGQTLCQRHWTIYTGNVCKC